MSSLNASSNYFQDLITSITLHKSLTLNTLDSDARFPSDQLANLLTITATRGDGSPANVFVYQANTADYNTWVKNASFTNVCSPNDWQELPIGVPTDDSVTLFRLNTVTCVCRTITEAETVYTSIVGDVKSLVNIHKLLLNPPVANLTQTDVITAS